MAFATLQANYKRGKTMKTHTNINLTTRRYDIDWLRVIAFGLLILYHVGMYYVTDWGWHIKSDSTSTLLQNVMILTNPWRMSLMFFIAAMALAFIVQKYPPTKLMQLRTTRLFVPLLFGMFVIVAPQPYIEALSQGLIEPGFWQFWLEYINPNTSLLKDEHGPIGLLTWNHLWFLPYLWVYSLIAIICVRPLVAFANSNLLAKTPFLIFGLVIAAVLIVNRFLLGDLFPTTHDLVNDWYNHVKYGFVFIVGFVFTLQQRWWQFVINQRNWFLLVALICYSFIIADRHLLFPELAEAFHQHTSIKILYRFIYSINHWCWIFAAVGLAGFWLNKPSRVLSYANTAILPWYMLHQTLIVMFAWWLKSFNIHAGVESAILIALTILSCLLGYGAIKRIPPLAWACGLKPSKKAPSAVQNALTEVKP